MPNPKSYWDTKSQKYVDGIELTKGEQLILLKKNNKLIREQAIKTKKVQDLIKDEYYKEAIEEE